MEITKPSYKDRKKAKKSSKSKASSSNKSPGRLPRVSNKKQSVLDKKRAKVLMYEYKSKVNAYRRLDDAIAETAPNEERWVDILEKNATNIGVISSPYDKIRSELKMNT